MVIPDIIYTYLYIYCSAYKIEQSRCEVLRSDLLSFFSVPKSFATMHIKVISEVSKVTVQQDQELKPESE